MPYYIIEDIVPAEEGSKNITVRVHSCSGGIPEGKPALLFPSGRPLKLKKITSMYGDKYLLELRGIVRKALKPGQMIISPLFNPLTSDSGLFVSTVETVIGRGTFQASPSIPPLFSEDRKRLTGKILETRIPGLFRGYFDKKALLIPGASYSFKGEKERGFTEMVYLDKIPSDFEEWKILEKIIAPVKQEPNLKNVYLFLLKKKKALFAPPAISEMPLKGYAVKNNLIIELDLLESTLKTIEKLALVQGGYPRKDLSSKTKLDSTMIPPLLAFLEAENKISVSSGYIQNITVKPEERLSPMGEAVYKRVKDKKDEGVKPSTLREKNSRLILEELERMGLILLSDRAALTIKDAQTIRDEIHECRIKEPKANLNRLTEMTGRSREILHTVLKWEENQP